MPPETAAAHPTSFLGTQRQDAWWVQPAVTMGVLLSFVAYATFRVFENGLYSATQGHMEYHTPFGSPDLTGLLPGFLLDIPLIGPFFGYPAVIILPFVAGFRFTCYYYRKAYYRSFVARPAGCSVEATKGKKYRGERGLMIVQNVHRYFFYAALVVLSFNIIDTTFSVLTPEHGGVGSDYHLGLGTGIMVLNCAFLSFYTLGCHSFRHLVGGKLDCFSCDAVSHVRYGIWSKVTMLNQRHQLWAWTSLVWVLVTDVYIRFLAGHPDVTHWFGVVPV